MPFSFLPHFFFKASTKWVEKQSHHFSTRKAFAFYIYIYIYFFLISSQLRSSKWIQCPSVPHHPLDHHLQARPKHNNARDSSDLMERRIWKFLKSEKYKISTLEHVGISERMDLENLVKNGTVKRRHAHRRRRRVRSTRREEGGACGRVRMIFPAIFQACGRLRIPSTSVWLVWWKRVGYTRNN